MDDWQNRAACKGKGVLFLGSPDKETVEGHLTRVSICQDICARCPVYQQCWLEQDGIEDLDGVWAGLDRSPRGRRINARAIAALLKQQNHSVPKVPEVVEVRLQGQEDNGL